MTAAAPKGLMEALLAVQSSVGTLPKDAVNPHFKSTFTPLDTIVEQVGPLLASNGLVWTTLPGSDSEGHPVLNYRLIHAATGETLEGTMPLLLAKQDAQGLGSAITYARRYSMTAVLNLVADNDDDGHQASRAGQVARANGNGHRQPSADPVQQTARVATAKQRGLINVRASESGMSAQQLANVVMAATGNQPREFDSDEQAGAWLARGLDRLPASAVDKVLEGIAQVMA